MMAIRVRASPGVSASFVAFFLGGIVLLLAYRLWCAVWRGRGPFFYTERKSNDVDVGIIDNGGGLRRVGEMLLSCFLVALTGGASRRGNDNGAEYQRCDQSLQ